MEIGRSIILSLNNGLQIMHHVSVSLVNDPLYVNKCYENLILRLAIATFNEIGIFAQTVLPRRRLDAGGKNVGTRRLSFNRDY